MYDHIDGFVRQLVSDLEEAILVAELDLNVLPGGFDLLGQPDPPALVGPGRRFGSTHGAESSAPGSATQCVSAQSLRSFRWSPTRIVKPAMPAIEKPPWMPR